jgi:excisionase family DNA binding protein
MACKSIIFGFGVGVPYRTGTADSCRLARAGGLRGRPGPGGLFEQDVAGEPTGGTKRDSLAAGLVWRSVMAGDPHKDAFPSMQTPSHSSQPTSETSGRQRRGAAVSSRADTRRSELLTTAQAAAALEVHERTVRRYMASGLLGFRRLPGGHYRIPVEALDELWQANEPHDERRRPSPSPDRTHNPRRPTRRLHRSPRSPRREVRLGELTPGNYDLSTATLRAVRAHLS